MPIPQSCIEALLIESGRSLPYSFRILKSVMLIQGGRGVPAQKFVFFVTAGGRTATSFADRLLAHTQQAFAHTIIRDVQIETTTNHMHWIWYVWINAIVLIPTAQAPAKAFFAGSLRKALPQKHAFVEISVFLCLRKQQPRFAQGLFSLERTWQDHWGYCPNEWNVEKAERQHAPICASTCQHGPTFQFVSCAEKESVCGTVMHDGLNLTCLDQYHGVCSHDLQ